MWNHENLVRKEKKRNEKKTTPNREAWRNHLSERKPHKPFSLYVFFQHEKNMIGFDRSLVPFSTTQFSIFLFQIWEDPQLFLHGLGFRQFLELSPISEREKKKRKEIGSGSTEGGWIFKGNPNLSCFEKSSSTLSSSQSSSHWWLSSLSSSLASQSRFQPEEEDIRKKEMKKERKKGES